MKSFSGHVFESLAHHLNDLPAPCNMLFPFLLGSWQDLNYSIGQRRALAWAAARARIGRGVAIAFPLALYGAKGWGCRGRRRRISPVR
eukprot:701973-Pyramimonas_sp.AAC.1